MLDCYFLAELSSLVMDFFPMIEYEWTKKNLMTISPPIEQTTITQFLMKTGLVVGRKGKCREGWKICRYCSLCKCELSFKPHNNQDGPHRFGRFVRKNAPWALKHQWDIVAHRIQFLNQQLIQIVPV